MNKSFRNLSYHYYYNYLIDLFNYEDLKTETAVGEALVGDADIVDGERAFRLGHERGDRLGGVGRRRAARIGVGGVDGFAYVVGAQMERPVVDVGVTVATELKSIKFDIIKNE